MLRGARGGVQYIYNLTNFDNRSESDLTQSESDLTQNESNLTQFESNLTQFELNLTQFELNLTHVQSFSQLKFSHLS